MQLRIIDSTGKPSYTVTPRWSQASRSEDSGCS